MVTIKPYRQGMSDHAEGSPWTKEESRKFVGKWTRTYRKGYDDYREEPGERYRKFESLFGLQKRLASADADKDRNLN
jgi:hypothetical protein